MRYEVWYVPSTFAWSHKLKESACNLVLRCYAAQFDCQLLRRIRELSSHRCGAIAISGRLVCALHHHWDNHRPELLRDERVPSLADACWA